MFPAQRQSNVSRMYTACLCRSTATNTSLTAEPSLQLCKSGAAGHTPLSPPLAMHAHTLVQWLQTFLGTTRTPGYKVTMLRRCHQVRSCPHTSPPTYLTFVYLHRITLPPTNSVPTFRARSISFLPNLTPPPLAPPSAPPSPPTTPFAPPQPIFPPPPFDFYSTDALPPITPEDPDPLPPTTLEKLNEPLAGNLGIPAEGPGPQQ